VDHETDRTASALLAERSDYLRVRTALTDDMSGFEVVLTLSDVFADVHEAMAERTRVARVLADVMEAEGLAALWGRGRDHDS
jgi:hypothetical protein